MGKGFERGFLVPGRALWLKKRLCYWLPIWKQSFWDGKGLSRGLLSPWESPCVTYGSAMGSLYGNKAFGCERASMGLLGRRKSL